MPKVTNICSDEAEAIQELPPNTVLISIGEESEDFWNLKVDGEKVLKLKFSDVRALTKHAGAYYRPIKVEQAHEIINFIQKWNGCDFIVNCAAGISRSGAIAMFLHLHFGYELKPNFYKLSEPNPFVLGLLIVEFYKSNMNIYEHNNQ